MSWEDIIPEDIIRMKEETEMNYPEPETEWEKNGFASEEDYWRWRGGV